MLDLFIAVKGCFGPKIALLKNSRYFKSKLKRGIFKLPNRVNLSGESFKPAFSLVEMLMALLVASLLLAALAPVMTKRINDSMTISIEGEIPGKTTKIHEIEYDSVDCPGGTKLKTDTDGSQYCEGEFTVPSGYNGQMKVTVIGAGGGGGTAPTAGYIEYTNAGSTPTFQVPVMVNKIEATLVGGGAGGGAGGKAETYKDWTTGGTFAWTDMPANIRNTYVKVTACGGGGGGGSAMWTADNASWVGGGGGGSGGYVQNIVRQIPSSGNISLIIGGGGGAAGGNNGCGQPGRAANGGGGGSECGANMGGAGNGEGGNGGRIAADNFAGGYTVAKAGKGGVDGTISLLVNSVMQPGKGGVTAIAGNGGDVWGEVQSGAGATTGGATMGGGSGGTLGGGGGGGGMGARGGGGGGATQVAGFTGGEIVLAGGGGGGTGVDYVYAIGGSGGGGGGGISGGNGGYGFIPYEARGGQGGAGGLMANWGTGRAPDTPWSGAGTANSNCFGGNGHSSNGTLATSGKDGAARIQYATNASGGSGGGGGAIVPYQTVMVNPSETLTVNLASRANGGATGGYNSSGTFSGGGNGVVGNTSYLKRGETVLLTTNNGHWTHSGIYTGASCSSASSRCGSVFDGIKYIYSNNWNGASNVNGLGANNAAYNLNTCISGAVNSDGGRGGYVNLFGIEKWCTPAEGGNASHPDGFDAAQPGCGGGGGSHGGKGGSGAGGYARISWNKYWDTAVNAYRYAEVGTAGGGASGNIATYTIDVRSGERIKFRIGKGGNGASVNNNVLTNAQKGGDTVFAVGTNRTVKAGGGNSGGSPTITGTYPDTTIANGDGGSANEVYTYKGQTIRTRCNNNSIISDCYIPSIAGNSGTSNAGGSGATLERNDKILRTNVNNSGGGGGTTGDNAQGKSAAGYGSGGGGAGILDIGIPAISTHNPNTGGNGTHGKIILEWWE